MRILLWVVAVVAVPILFVFHAAITGGRGVGGVVNIILWSPLIIAFFIDRAIVNNREERRQVRAEINSIKKQVFQAKTNEPVTLFDSVGDPIQPQNRISNEPVFEEEAEQAPAKKPKKKTDQYVYYP